MKSPMRGTRRTTGTTLRVLAVLVAALTALAPLTLLPIQTASAQINDVVISEIFYNPNGPDEGHEFIELHNTSSSSVAVSGWNFATGIDFTFPVGATIPANGYVVLARTAADFQTVFGFAPTGSFDDSLSNSGENLTLTNAAGLVIDQVIYNDAAPWPTTADGDGDSLVAVNTSLAPDDPAGWVAGTPTPQVANDPVLTVAFSVQRGWYSGSRTLTLTPSVPGASITYNTNGSGVANTLYTGPISVSDNNDVQVVQAQASANGQASNLVTHTYVFKVDNGVPVVATWPNGLAVAPGEDEVTRSFEFIPPPSTGLTPAAGNAGVKESEGGFQGVDSDKIFFRGAYGNGTLTGDLFGDNYYGIEPATSTDQLFLRNLHGDETHLRQIFAHDALLAMGQLSPHGRFIEYYRDGTDEGPRHMQERPEGGFMESYTGIDKDNWIAWSTHEATPGTGTPNGLGGQTLGAPFSSWSDATTAINVESLVDYLLVQWQAKVSDYRNIKNFRIAGPTSFGNANGGDYRYHFFNWDMDLGYSNDLYGRGGPTGWGWAAFASPDYIAHDLDQFPEFRMLAADRIVCAFTDGGPLTREAFAPRMEARRQELVAAGGANQSTFVSNLGSWIESRNDWLINDGFTIANADTTVYGTFRPDTAPWKPPTNFTGPLLGSNEQLAVDVSSGVLSISNPNGGPVYYRLDGGDVRNPNGTLSANAIAYDGPVSVPAGRLSVIARSFDATQNDPFQAWSPACNDGKDYDVAVSGNPGASPGAGLIITEIQYNPDPFHLSDINDPLAEFLEIHNTTAAPINASGFSFTDGIDFVFPGGTIIQPGEYAVIIPEGAEVAYQVEYQPIDDGVAPATPVGTFDGRLGDGGETLTIVDAVGGLVDTVTYDDIAPWPAGADGTGPSLALTDLSADNDLAASWAQTMTSGTPGSANTFSISGDVNCDGRLSVADAVVIAQFTVGLRVAEQTCPLRAELNGGRAILEPAADPNESDTITVADAVIVAQCIAGITNGFCPE